MVISIVPPSLTNAPATPTFPPETVTVPASLVKSPAIEIFPVESVGALIVKAPAPLTTDASNILLPPNVISPAFDTFTLKPVPVVANVPADKISVSEPAAPIKD